MQTLQLFNLVLLGTACTRSLPDKDYGQVNWFSWVVLGSECFFRRGFQLNDLNIMSKVLVYNSKEVKLSINKSPPPQKHGLSFW